ncbi:MAG: hypothetical protein K2X39_06525 [Silvanigrellaceae bacterium]|nr:hypothetical protein [Silvanigrellaceae bacterium]
MLNLTAKQNVEVVFLYRPLGLNLFEGTFESVKFTCRNCSEQQIENELQNVRNKLCLFIVTHDQFLCIIEKFEETIVQILNENIFGFFIVEDPQNRPTLKLRKKMAKFSKYIYSEIKIPYSQAEVLKEFYKALYYVYLKSSNLSLNFLLELREAESKIINDFSLAISNSKSPQEFIDLILAKCVEISSADVGFIFLNDAGQNNEIFNSENEGSRFLKKAYFSHSVEVLENPSILLAKSSLFNSLLTIKGHCLSWFEQDSFVNVIGKNNIKQVQMRLQPELNFDKNLYKIKSYCAFPIKTPLGKCIGFILLCNKKTNSSLKLKNIFDIDEHVVDFSVSELNILGALANQSGLSLDHGRLIDHLKSAFDSFVEASINAIESRDPTTKGHSERVALMTIGLAKAVSEVKIGKYAGLEFNKTQIKELKYAALLHDFGKIGVRESVLNKEKKLYDHEIDLIKERFFLLERRFYIARLEQYIKELMEKNQAPNQSDLMRLRLEAQNLADKLKQYFQVIQDVNEPAVVNLDTFEQIAEIAVGSLLIDGKSEKFLFPSEIEKLSIKKGSLSYQERLEIQSHVVHSYNFLIRIPWSEELKGIPEIVRNHHERLNGSGYPRQLVTDEICVQSRIMAIADIYDALVAQDRPYKKAILHEQALFILEEEVNGGRLDGELFKIFVKYKIGDLIKRSPSEVMEFISVA